MIEQEIQVINKLGIHARPASLIVKTANAFESNIWISKDSVTANAKSIMSVMMLAAGCNSTVMVGAKGKDERKAVEAIAKLFAEKFSED
jgi:phosphocarrier protein HPr